MRREVGFVQRVFLSGSASSIIDFGGAVSVFGSIQIRQIRASG